MIINIGDYVHISNGHQGRVIKRYKPTASAITIQIVESDGRIYYCPEYMVIKNS